jgi:hypothetical protein
MMPINSKRKGKAGELEFVKFCKEKFGIDAKRSQQFKGGVDSADIETSWCCLHWEIKRVQALNVSKAMEQAKQDAEWKLPVIAHRKNGEEWLLTLRAEDLIAIAGCVHEHRLASNPHVPRRDAKRGSDS